MMAGRFNLSQLFIVSVLSIFLGLASPSADACDSCGCSNKASAKSSSNCDQSNGQCSARGQSIVDVAVEAGSFKTLVSAVKAAGLVDTLSGKGPFTVFAPTDEAFARIPEEDLKSLLKPENKSKLTAILTYHVVPAKVMASDVVKLISAKTVNGQSAGIQVKDGQVFIDKARVVKTDISASNGIIHVIDSVIMPDFRSDIVKTAIDAGSFSTLVSAVKAAGLESTLQGEGPFTVFAPSDAAFAKLPDGTLQELLKPENKDKLKTILTFHVVPGAMKAEQAIKSKSARTVNGQSLDVRMEKGVAYVGDAMITTSDIEARNGVIHVIDTVLIPQ